MAVSVSYIHLESEALHLPIEERSKLASRLLESLDDDDGFQLTPEWKDELQRRSDEMDSGKARMVPATEVSDNVRARLAEVRAERQ